MTDNPDKTGQPEKSPPPRRRERYGGKYPRSFAQKYKELDPQAYPDMAQHVRDRGRTPAGSHVPIMVASVLEQLAPKPGQIVADCTLGYGGHAEAFLGRIGPTGRLVGLDLDAQALQRTAERLAALGLAVTAVRGNFAGIVKAMAELGIAGFDVIFADLGVSSMQLDDPERGFSYKQDGPLDMRMDDRNRSSAADLLARLSRQEISDALWELADEEDHEVIAQAIVQRRAARPITRTRDLTDLVFRAKGADPEPFRQAGASAATAPNPAAKTFQALRILVNHELANLRELLRIAPSCLNSGGRIGILSFHSGEDRLVKQAFADGLKVGAYAAISPEPLRPTRQEVYDNPRASAAKFRWAAKP